MIDYKADDFDEQLRLLLLHRVAFETTKGKSAQAVIDDLKKAFELNTTHLVDTIKVITEARADDYESGALAASLAFQKLVLAKPPATWAYGSGVRDQVFEVVVRQAVKGAPWREICKAPMEAAGIDPEAVEAEVQRRRGSDGAAAGKKK